MAQRIQGVTSKVYNGVKYRSTLEANTAEVLTLMKLPFEYEKKRITLLETFKSPFEKNQIRSVHYTPDFMIKNIMLECKGFETPEWRLKKKYVYKYLMENEPNIIFYQIKNCGKDLVMALDNHWSSLGYAIEVIPKLKKKEVPISMLFPSIKEALQKLNLVGRALGPIVKSIIGKKDYVYGYKWKLKKLKL